MPGVDAKRVSEIIAAREEVEAAAADVGQMRLLQTAKANVAEAKQTEQDIQDGKAIAASIAGHTDRLKAIQRSIVKREADLEKAEGKHTTARAAANKKQVSPDQTAIGGQHFADAPDFLTDTGRTTTRGFQQVPVETTGGTQFVNAWSGSQRDVTENRNTGMNQAQTANARRNERVDQYSRSRDEVEDSRYTANQARLDETTAYARVRDAQADARLEREDARAEEAKQFERKVFLDERGYRRRQDARNTLERDFASDQQASRYINENFSGLSVSESEEIYGAITGRDSAAAHSFMARHQTDGQIAATVAQRMADDRLEIEKRQLQRQINADKFNKNKFLLGLTNMSNQGVTGSPRPGSRPAPGGGTQGFTDSAYTKRVESILDNESFQVNSDRHAEYQGTVLSIINRESMPWVSTDGEQLRLEPTPNILQAMQTVKYSRNPQEVNNAANFLLKTNSFDVRDNPNGAGILVEPVTDGPNIAASTEMVRQFQSMEQKRDLAAEMGIDRMQVGLSGDGLTVDFSGDGSVQPSGMRLEEAMPGYDAEVASQRELASLNERRSQLEQAVDTAEGRVRSFRRSFQRGGGTLGPSHKTQSDEVKQAEKQARSDLVTLKGKLKQTRKDINQAEANAPTGRDTQRRNAASQLEGFLNEDRVKANLFNTRNPLPK